jgi:5'-methylthioadenosine phosphorylase
MAEKPVLAVIGGSGLYNMGALKDIQTHEVNTPFGKPSAPIVIGTLCGKRVAFLARHGIGHHISPSEVNYRANIFALKGLGAARIVSISACGSLRDDFAPGHIVIPDQLFDFTKGNRARSFFGEGMVVHISSADPFCQRLSDQVFNAVKNIGAVVHKGGSFITIEGPRFSTRAESIAFRSWQMSIIGMTASPEAFLAREAEMCYATMAHVTDYDCWHTSEKPVTVEMVIRTLLQNTASAQKAIETLVETLDEDRLCACECALADAIITQRDSIPQDLRLKLSLLVDKYFSG